MTFYIGDPSKAGHCNYFARNNLNFTHAILLIYCLYFVSFWHFLVSSALNVYFLNNHNNNHKIT